MRSRHALRPLAVAGALALVAAACGGTDDGAQTADQPDATTTEEVEPVRVVATTSILGDIVSQLVGEEGEVTVLMGPGVDPHGYAPSARDAATMREVDLVVANGLDLEESLVSTLEATAEAGVPVFELAPPLDPIEFEDDHDHGHEDEGDDHGHDDEGDDHGHGDEGDDHGHEDEGDDHGHGDEGDDHGHEDEGDDHGHDHGPEDPHVWFDAERMAMGVELLAAELAEVAPQVDAEEWAARADAYNEQLRDVDAELAEAFEAVPDDRRVIVTNHDALGYLAHRYDLEVVGTVVPGSSTQAESDPRQFAELIDLVEEHDIRAIFADNVDSTRLAEQLASEALGRADLEIEVVQVATDALGEPGSPTDTYLGLLRETGTTIAATLAAS